MPTRPPSRNIITFDVQGGFDLQAPLSSRPHDAVGLAVAYDRISARQSTRIRAENLLRMQSKPISMAETDVELDYTAKLGPWMNLTPDLQYLIHPGGGIADPENKAKTEPNAVVAQLEIDVKF